MTLEVQFIQALSALVYIVAIAGIGIITPKVKKFLETHIDAKTAAVASEGLDELTKITESVVTDFNNRLVNDAKSKQAWTPQLAEIVKNDALSSVKTQIEPLLSTLIEQAVTKAKEVK
jgi:hypothetical protein